MSVLSLKNRISSHLNNKSLILLPIMINNSLMKSNKIHQNHNNSNSSSRKINKLKVKINNNNRRVIKILKIRNNNNNQIRRQAVVIHNNHNRSKSRLTEHGILKTVMKQWIRKS